MEEPDIYPFTQRRCPKCNSYVVDEEVTYPEAQSWDYPGAGGYVDCTCINCNHYWTREFGPDDIPDEALL